MEYFELISVPVIAAIVYWTLYAIKCAVNSDKLNRFIPLLSALLGAVCGVVCFYAVPGIMPARNVCVALVIGASSGLSATGTHQIVKQLSKNNCNDKSDAPQSDNSAQTEEQETSTDESVAITQDKED